VDKRLRPLDPEHSELQEWVSILGLVDKRLRRLILAAISRSNLVSILGLVDKRLRHSAGSIRILVKLGFNPWFSG